MMVVVLDHEMRISDKADESQKGETVGRLKLELDRPRVAYRKGESGLLSKSGWQLSWRTRFDRWDSVKLSNGLDLSKMPGTLFLTVGEIDPGEAEKELVPEGALFFEKPGAPLGLLHFLEAQEGSSDGVAKAEPDAYSIELVATEEELRTFIDKVQAAQGPSAATVNVPGLKYGWAPDGSQQEWNLDEKKNWLIVDGLTFYFGDKEDEEVVPIEDREEEGELPPTPEARALRDLAKVVKGYGSALVVGLGLIFLALVLR
jgi:hypothetical protein